MTADHVRLRPATAADAALVGRLLNDFNSEFGDPTPTADEFAGRFARLLDGDDLEVVLAEEFGSAPGSAIAFALVTYRPTPYWDGPVALLEELYVRPARRGQGIGTLLMDRVEEMVRARGSEELHINVDGEDSGARRFYERRGYRTVQPDAPNGEAMYFYEKSLD